MDIKPTHQAGDIFSPVRFIPAADFLVHLMVSRARGQGHLPVSQETAYNLNCFKLKFTWQRRKEHFNMRRALMVTIILHYFNKRIATSIQ